MNKTNKAPALVELTFQASVYKSGVVSISHNCLSSRTSFQGINSLCNVYFSRHSLSVLLTPEGKAFFYLHSWDMGNAPIPPGMVSDQ